MTLVHEENTGSPDFREESIYFLLTTRFYDGDSSNNFFCRDRIKFNAAGKAEDPHWRGDFKGLIQRLDYIRDLGFSAIWITPPIENRSGLDYHGYHSYDWTRIDPRLGSPDATYQDLIDAAHARGIKIIQDVVINHSCQYGIPCLYFGEEIEFMKGAPQDVIGNDDTLDSTGRAYFGDHLIDGRIEETRNHPLYQHIKRLKQVRSAIPALQKAPMSHVNEWGSGLSFVRDWNDGESYVMVGLTIGVGLDITIGSIREGTYHDAVTGNKITAVGGTLSFHVNDNSAGIYVRDGPGKIGVDGAYLR